MTTVVAIKDAEDRIVAIADDRETAMKMLRAHPPYPKGAFTLEEMDLSDIRLDMLR